MVLRMTRPTRRQGSSFLTYRKRVPADILAKAANRAITIQFPAEAGDPAHTLTVKIGLEVKFSLRTRSPSVAKSRTSIANAHLERMWEAITFGPKKLTHKQVVALAGKLYRDFADNLEDDPGSAATWEAVLVWNEVAAKGGFANPMTIPIKDQARVNASLEQRLGKLVDVVLQREGLVIDADSRIALLRESAKRLSQAAHKIKRNAEGDYSPDPVASQLPTWEAAQQLVGSAKVTLSSLLTGWKTEAEKRNLALSTIKDYESRLGLFKKWLKHDDATKVTDKDALAYKDHRLETVSVKTVKDSDLAALKTLFQWGVDNKKLSANPFAGIKLKPEKKAKERPNYFLKEEVQSILRLSQSYKRTNDQELAKTAAAKRWLPWICAYSGARIGEVAQLRREDFFQEGKAWFLRITPEAGPVKTKEARIVPIHEHLVAEGLIKFVEGSKHGYLFLNAKDKADATKKQEPCKNRVQEFIRSVVPDKRIQPNHGWRHTFKTIAIEADISGRVIDAIVGHAPSSVGDRYGEVTTQALRMGIKKFPRYKS